MPVASPASMEAIWRGALVGLIHAAFSFHTRRNCQSCRSKDFRARRARRASPLAWKIKSPLPFLSDRRPLQDVTPGKIENVEVADLGRRLYCSYDYRVLESRVLVPHSPYVQKTTSPGPGTH